MHDTVFEVWISVLHAIIIIIKDYLTIFDLSQDLLTMLNRLMQSLSTIVKCVISALCYTEKWLFKVYHWGVIIKPCFFDFYLRLSSLFFLFFYFSVDWLKHTFVILIHLIELFNKGYFETVSDGHGYLLIELLSDSLTLCIFFLYIDGIALVVAHVIPDVAPSCLLFLRLWFANCFIWLSKAGTSLPLLLDVELVLNCWLKLLHRPALLFREVSYSNLLF